MADFFSNMTTEDKEKNSKITSIASIVLGAMAAIWSFLFNFVCGWLAWPLAFIGILLAVASLMMKKTKPGYVGLGLSVFAFVYPFIVMVLMGGAAAIG